jgi:hypothetical protein
MNIQEMAEQAANAVFEEVCSRLEEVSQAKFDEAMEEFHRAFDTEYMFMVNDVLG